MKNAIFIQIDTESKTPIMFGKPPEIPAPTNEAEAKTMILNDIAWLAEAITTLIIISGEKNYGNKTELVAASINTINQALTNK